MTDFLRAYVERAASGAKAGEPMRFVASTQNVARDGMVIPADAWQLDNFNKNPVFLFSHDYFSRPPIGKVTAIAAEDERLIADVVFDQGDPFAVDIERKYRDGFLSAVSVGWDTLSFEPPNGPNTVPRVTKADLLDVSAVMVPSDPDALKERQKRGLADVGAQLVKLIEPEDDAAGDEEPSVISRLATELSLDANLADDLNSTPPQHRGAIPPHTTEKLPEDTAWDGPGEVAKAEGKAQLRRMHTWVDDDADDETKRAYKLPHHMAMGEVVWRGVAAAMARLLQAGTQIPDADRRGTYNHLQRHYRQFDREPPEFRTTEELDAYSPTEIRGLFLEGEPELFPDVFAISEQRAGKAINARNRERLEQAASLIAEVLNSVKKQADDDEERTVTEIVSSLDDLFAGVKL